MPTKISTQVIKQILQLFAFSDGKLNDLTLFSPEKGYRNTIIPFNFTQGQPLQPDYSLIFYKREPQIVQRIKRANFLSNHLADHDWPTRHTINNHGQQIVKVTHQKKSYYCCLYNYLPGNTISWEAYSRKHLKLTGQILSNLHQQLQLFKLETKLAQSVFSELQANLDQMQQYFARQEVIVALQAKLNLSISDKIYKYLTRIIMQASQIKNQQWLHLDFVRSNLLFSVLTPAAIKQHRLSNFAWNEGGNKQARLTLTGILDFEKATVGPTIVDIARTLAFLLVDCKYKSEQKIRKYFLHSGYRKRGQSKLDNLELLNPLIDFFWFYDFYKFLSHNPYQFLPENEHFVRTKKRLVRRQLLKEANQSELIQNN